MFNLKNSFSKGGRQILILFVLLLVFFTPIKSGFGVSIPVYYQSMNIPFGNAVGNPIVVNDDCISNSCIEFNGYSGISYGSGPEILSSVQNVTTYSLWFKPSNDIISLQYIFVQEMNYTVSNAIVVGRGVFIQNGDIWVFTRQANATWEQINLGPISTFAWYHLTLVQNGTDLAGYVNGVSTRPSITFSGVINTYLDYWSIGSLLTGIYGFNGRIDELRVFGSALNSSDVISLYNSDIAKKLGNPILNMDFNSNYIYSNNDSVINHGVQIQQIDNTSSGYFNGLSYIELPNNNSLRTNRGTVIAWIKTNSSGTIFSLGDSSSNNYYLMLNIDATNMTFYYNENNPQKPYGTIVSGFTPNTTLIDNHWHQIIWESNGTFWKGYIDGMAVTLNPVISSGNIIRGENDGTWFNKFNYTTNTFSIGILNRPSKYGNFTGYIDDLKVYSRTIDNFLSNNQIKTTSSSIITTSPFTQRTSSSSSSNYYQINSLTTLINDFLNNLLFPIIFFLSIIAIGLIGVYIRQSRNKSTFKISNGKEIRSADSMDQQDVKKNLHNQSFICVNCKSEINDQDNFCQNCGSPIINLFALK